MNSRRIWTAFNTAEISETWSNNPSEMTNVKLDPASILSSIQSIRERNNANWMDLARLAFETAPDRAREIMRRIHGCDSEINKLTEELSR